MFDIKNLIPRISFGAGKNVSKKSLSMSNLTPYIETDRAGNTWYYNGFSYILDFLNSKKGNVSIDMSSLIGKRIALSTCTPFSYVADKCGSMLSNGKFYVQDADGNEHNSPKTKDGKTDSLYSKYEELRRLLRKPNPLQSGRQFNKQVEIHLKAFGFCPIYTFRAIKTSLPISMWIIPPELFHAELTGKLWNQYELSGIIKKAYIEWAGEQIILEEGDYFIITDAQSQVISADSELRYNTVIDSLSKPVSSWMAQMMARYNLIIDGGPKGIISDNTPGDSFGNSSLTPEEKDNLNQNFKNKYGIVNKLYSIWVTTANVKWTPITYNSKDLMLHEEDESCQNYISNAIGLNPNVFISDSKYANQDGAKRDAYQDLIIPDSENYTEVLTSAIAGEGIFIKLDYSHISVLQEDKQSSSSAFFKVSSAVSSLYSKSLITDIEVRKELSNYIDINPDQPEGNFIEPTNNTQEGSNE